MLKQKISGLPVVDDGKLVGIVTTSDMLMALLGVIDTISARASRPEDVSESGICDRSRAGLGRIAP